MFPLVNTFCALGELEVGFAVIVKQDFDDASPIHHDKLIEQLSLNLTFYVSKATPEADPAFVTGTHCKVFDLITLFAVYYLDVSGS